MTLTDQAGVEQRRRAVRRRFAEFVIGVIERHNRRRSLRALGNLSDHLLRDIGYEHLIPPGRKVKPMKRRP